jgi:hypothetical protein
MLGIGDTQQFGETRRSSKSCALPRFTLRIIPHGSSFLIAQTGSGPEIRRFRENWLGSCFPQYLSLYHPSTIVFSVIKDRCSTFAWTACFLCFSSEDRQQNIWPRDYWTQ